MSSSTVPHPPPLLFKLWALKSIAVGLDGKQILLSCLLVALLAHVAALVRANHYFCLKSAQNTHSAQHQPLHITPENTAIGSNSMLKRASALLNSKNTLLLFSGRWDGAQRDRLNGPYLTRDPRRTFTDYERA